MKERALCRSGSHRPLFVFVKRFQTSSISEFLSFYSLSIALQSQVLDVSARCSCLAITVVASVCCSTQTIHIIYLIYLCLSFAYYAIAGQCSIRFDEIVTMALGLKTQSREEKKNKYSIKTRIQNRDERMKCRS